MKPRIFRAPTSKEALARIHRELGPGATIISHDYVKASSGNTWVEVTVSVPAEKEEEAGKRLDARSLAFLAVGLVSACVVIVAMIIIVWPRERVVLLPGEKPLIAVMYFENGTGDRDLDHWQANIANSLTTDLAQSKYLRVVGSPRITNILTEMGYVRAQSFPSEILEQIVARTGAAYIVTGRFMKAENTFSLTMQLHESATGEVIATERLHGQGKDSIYAMVDDMTVKIKEHLGFDEEQIASDIDAMIEKMSARSPEAIELWARGMEHYWKDDFDLALPFFEKAIDYEPGFVMCYISISNAYSSMGITSKAYEWAIEAREYSDSASIWERHMIDIAVYIQSAKTMDKAIASQQETLKVYTNDYWALYIIGFAHGLLEDYAKGAEYLERARQELPDSEWIENLWGLAVCHEALGHMEKAEETLKLLKETFPDDHRTYSYRFWHYIRQQDQKQAEVEAAKAIALGPKSRTRHFEPVLAYYNGDYVEAGRIYEGYISNDSRSVQNVGREGLVRINLLFGKINKALSHYQPLLELIHQQGCSPVPTHCTFARLNALLGNYDRAIECLDEGLESLNSLVVVPQYYYHSKLLALALKGEYQLGLNRVDLALETAEELKRQISDQHNSKLDRYYHYLMGNIALKRGNNAGAIEQFKQAQELLSGQKYNPRNLYYLAKAYFTANDLDNAEKHFLKVLDHPQTGYLRDDYQSPDAEYLSADRPDLYAKSYYMLGRIYQARGDTQKAIEHYEKFLSYWGNADPELAEPDDARAQIALLRRGGG